jgi:hypothetical protein
MERRCCHRRGLDGLGRLDGDLHRHERLDGDLYRHDSGERDHASLDRKSSHELWVAKPRLQELELSTFNWALLETIARCLSDTLGKQAITASMNVEIIAS